MTKTSFKETHHDRSYRHSRPLARSGRRRHSPRPSMAPTATIRIDDLKYGARGASGWVRVHSAARQICATSAPPVSPRANLKMPAWRRPLPRRSPRWNAPLPAPATAPSLALLMISRPLISPSTSSASMLPGVGGGDLSWSAARRRSTSVRHPAGQASRFDRQGYRL